MAAPPPTSSVHESVADELLRKIKQKTAVVGVIGLGYVGLPLVRAVHEAGYRTIGYDADSSKIEQLANGQTYLKHLGDDMARTLAASVRFDPTSDMKRLAGADVIILCLPTPLGSHREPDLSYVLNATREVANMLRPGQLVVLESTTHPGTTRGEMLPILEQSGLTCGQDFFLAYSPEREDPGRADASTATIPKLVGGVDERSTELAKALYERIVREVHQVRSAEIAEAAKLLENIFRAVNIALVNEMKTLLTEMDIDVWEVIAAASTKPFGFMPFYPGPGLGGHCIPIDPFYLSWKAKEIGSTTKFIELAGEINSNMPRYVISRVLSALNEQQKAIKGSIVLVVGIAYKPNIDDIRESPAAEIIELLKGLGADVSYHDPHVPCFPPMRRYDIELASVNLNEQLLAACDCVVIVTDHDAVNYNLIGRCAKLIVDTRNVMAKVEGVEARVVKA